MTNPDHNGWADAIRELNAEIERLRTLNEPQEAPVTETLRRALEEIRDHWANEYDHPRKRGEMYRGPYGIGITDGHRACTIIAEKALSLTRPQR